MSLNTSEVILFAIALFAATVNGDASKSSLTQEDEEIIMERLRELGYVE